MSNEMNFVERLLDLGYERYVLEFEKRKGRYDINFNPKNGWMGLVVYHPYEKFSKGNKIVELSLERFGVTDTEIKDGVITQNKVNEKHITVTIDNQIVYHNKFGILPPKEIQEKIYAN